MSQTIPVPVEMVDKLAAIARAMLLLTKELKERATQGEKPDVAISIPDLTPPEVIPPENAWFWSEEWQAKEREANEDIKAGKYKTFMSSEDFLADLHANV